ncbi:MAG: T9SS type A sorting domain-containing protein, partial [Chitinophagaceae bacterium]
DNQYDVQVDEICITTNYNGCAATLLQFIPGSIIPGYGFHNPIGAQMVRIGAYISNPGPAPVTNTTIPTSIYGSRYIELMPNFYSQSNSTLDMRIVSSCPVTISNCTAAGARGGIAVVSRNGSDSSLLDTTISDESMLEAEFQGNAQYVEEEGGNSSRIVRRKGAVQNVKAEDNHGIIIFPNPSSRVLKINTHQNPSLTQVEMHSVNGTIICRKVIPPSRHLQIDISSFPAGVYYVKFFENSRLMFYRQVLKLN